MKQHGFKILAASSLLFILVSCAAKYGPLNSLGGYSSNKIDDRMVEVSFRGNQHNTIDQVRRYLAYRCSEITLENGFSHYLVVEDKSYLETNSQLASDDLDIRVTSSMSGGVNMEVQNILGTQESVRGIHGIFLIKMMHGPDSQYPSASMDAAVFMDANKNLIKR